MTFQSIMFLLGLASFFAIIALLMGILSKQPFFFKLHWSVRQLIAMAVFGALAIIGSEVNIPYMDSLVNVRDVAPLLAGLLFGPVAGIGAGLIGGLDRIFRVSGYSALACGLTCIAAGLISGLINLLLNKNKKLFYEGGHFKWYYAFALGFIMELLHMAVFALTKVGDIAKAGEIIKTVWYTMAIGTAFGTALGVFLFKLCSGNVELLPLPLLQQRNAAKDNSVPEAE